MYSISNLYYAKFMQFTHSIIPFILSIHVSPDYYY